VAIEYHLGQVNLIDCTRWAAEFVRRQVAVIATPGSTLAILAAKAATQTIPIVFRGRERSGRAWSRRQSQHTRQKHDAHIDARH
jgi:hypothetical protein